MALKHEKPNSALMAELNEVKDAASELDRALETTRALPNEFPRAPIEDMLHSLCGLPDGSAAEARPILHAADRRLMRIRHNYFGTKPKNHDEHEPNHTRPTERGQALDERIAHLRNALGTALEECRKQENDGALNSNFDPLGEDDLDDEIESESLPEAYKQDMWQQSTKLEQALSNARTDARGILNTETQNSDNFLRGLKDTDNLNKMNRAELLFSKGRASIRKTLDHALSNRPKIMRVLANTIKSGVDVAEPLNKTWKKFKEDKIGFILKRTRRFADNIGNWADEAENRDDGKLPFILQPIPLIAPEVQEEAEQKSETLLKQNHPIPDTTARNVRKLDLSMSEFANLRLLVNCKWLQSLKLESTEIINILPLKNLRHLQTLHLDGTNISNIAPLQHLTKLDTLGIAATNITDITPLQNLVHLQSLRLDGTEIKNFSSLKHLTQLQSLRLVGTNINDLTPLENLSKLQTLDFVGAKNINNLLPIRGLSKLHTLGIGGTSINDIAILANIKKLRVLYALSLNITDWSPVAHVKTVLGRPKDWDA